MPFYRINGLVVHMKLSGPASSHPKPCVAQVGIESGRQQCCGISAFLCDWKLSDGSTCDAPLCDAHAHEVGLNRHLCPRHLAEQRAIQPGLF